MTQLPVQAACAAAATDGEFRIASRFWNATVRFMSGEETHLVEIGNGEPRMATDDATTVPSLTVAAPPAAWDRILEPAPLPFYHDIFAAVVKHDVMMTPTTEDAATSYYPAVRRFVELMRIARNEHAKV